LAATSEDSDIQMGSVHTYSDDESSVQGDSTDDDSSLSLYASDDDGTPSNLSTTDGKPIKSKGDREKVKVDSSIRVALSTSKAPLLAFFKPCSCEEYHANLARDSEVSG